MTAATALAGALLAASKTSSGSSSVTFIIFLVLIGLVGYFLLLRPQQRKARRQRETQSEIGVGDEVLTVGGIVGTVLDIDQEHVTIITGVDPEGAGPGVGAQPARMVLVRNAIARKIEPPAPPSLNGDAAATGGSVADQHPGYGGVPTDDDADDAIDPPGGATGGDDETRGTDGGSREGGEP